MNISHSPRDLPLGDFQNFGKLRCIEVSRRPNLYFWIAALCDKRRQPSDLQLQSNADQQIRLAQLQQKARLGFDKMRVLISPGEGFDIDLVATDFPGQRGHVGRGSHDI